jgi:putative acetyltransferase
MMNGVQIRQERPDDVAGIRRVNELAFTRAGEANLVDALRAARAAELSMVAELDGKVVGHVLFSPVTVESPGRVFPAVGLGPMAVQPDLQRLGIGSRLVLAGLSELCNAGHTVVVVLGHRTFYPRFGFEKASAHGVRWEHPAPDEAFMVLGLKPGALAGLCGVVRYRPEFATV